MVQEVYDNSKRIGAINFKNETYGVHSGWICIIYMKEFYFRTIFQNLFFLEGFWGFG